jgi:hypothetical protein
MFARANSKSQWWLRQSGGDTVAEPHRVDGPGAICDRDPYVGPNDAPVPKIWYFLLDNQPRPWHERGGGGSSSDSTRVLASVLGGGSERVPGGGDRWRGRVAVVLDGSATRNGSQDVAFPFASSCAMPFSIARIWFTKSSRRAPFCIEIGNGTEILSVAVAS